MTAWWSTSCQVKVPSRRRRVAKELSPAHIAACEALTTIRRSQVICVASLDHIHSLSQEPVLVLVSLVSTHVPGRVPVDPMSLTNELPSSKYM